jgi:hypothetical protein
MGVYNRGVDQYFGRKCAGETPAIAAFAPGPIKTSQNPRKIVPFFAVAVLAPKGARISN